jgi:hypothetical protein
MHFLCCLRTHYRCTSKRSKHKRNGRRTHRSQDSLPNSHPMSLPHLFADTTQPMSQSYTQPPPPARAQGAFEMPYTTLSHSSSSPSPFIRAAAVEHLFTPTPATGQHHTTTSLHRSHSSTLNSSNSIMISRARCDGPQGREDSPTLPGKWNSGGLPISKRIFRLSTQRFSMHSFPAQQETFLDDTSNSSSDNEDEPRSNLDDSGYVSKFATPNVIQGNEVAANATVMNRFIVTAPVKPDAGLFTTPPAQTKVSESKETRVAAELCDYRNCLRHKGICSDHAQPSVVRTARRDRRRMGRKVPKRYEPDVWMQIAPEYKPGLWSRGSMAL